MTEVKKSEISSHVEEFQIFHTTDLEKCKKLPNLEEFQIFPHDRCCKICFVAIYAVFRKICFVAIYAILCGDKLSPKLYMWRKMTNIRNALTSAVYRLIQQPRKVLGQKHLGALSKVISLWDRFFLRVFSWGNRQVGGSVMGMQVVKSFLVRSSLLSNISSLLMMLW